MRIQPASLLSGTVPLPGDKSISHRAALLLAMSDGSAGVTNFSESADCSATLNCLHLLGVQMEKNGSGVAIDGVGKAGFRPSELPLDCRNSGTTMRLLSGILAGQSFTSVLTGDESLQKRPMGRVIKPLESIGAVITSESDRAPFTITGRPSLRAAQIRPTVASAQIKSAILLAGLNCDGVMTVIEGTPTRDHTERMMRWLGAEVVTEKLADGATAISVSGSADLVARDIVVPGDVSAATFFMVAASALPRSEIKMTGVGMNGSRRAIVDVMQSLGADIEITNVRDACNEPVADIFVRGGIRDGSVRVKNIITDPATVANLIDELPALAVFGTQLGGGLEVRGAGELRVKESDRIAAVVNNLRKMGADVDEFDDGFAVRKSRLRGTSLESFGDHRIAMAFAAAALFADGPTDISGAECCEVSFPGFFKVLASVAMPAFRETING